MNAAGHVSPSTSSCAATATTAIVTSTSASASSPSARLSARSSRGEEYQPADSSSGGTNTSSTTCGVELDRAGCPGMNASAEPAEHEHDRVRDADVVGGAHEQHGGEQQREEELEVAHGARESRIARRCPLPAARCTTITSPARPTRRSSSIMYGDFQCPYCTAAQSIVRARAQAARRAAAVRVPPPAAARGPPGRPARRRGRRGGGRAGRVLGDARRALRQRRAASPTPTWPRWRERSGWMSSASAPS